MSNVKYLEYASPDLDHSEILRYMGCRSATAEFDGLIEKCLSECLGLLSYKAVYTEMPLYFFEDRLKLGDVEIKSNDLRKNLKSCERAVIFAATLGLGIDRLIMKYSRTSPSNAVCLQAIGAERIEALCNTFCKDIAVQYAKSDLATRPRFSPGYGDLPLSFQHDIFRILGCEKTLGLTLNDSLLMSPTKSVTAIVGIYNKTEKQ